ncbi:glycosyl hydrolase [Fulvivirga sp. M361]|uniref:glycoside hydrolase family 76 protein n=1 Tax=Fulvivirga sp. M361 TaxID=2594266 RepID=UPI001179F15C|nr:glycoside hydrolase family 76 protein [Fulvivirga sp. M361]TRX46364.1 glycosyl hydrolase [Fulvivirga sp. M361]
MKILYLLLIGIMLSIEGMAQYESYATLADQAQDKLHNSFRSSNGSYYIEKNGTSNTYFHYWWNAHALDVLVDAYLRTNDSKYVTRMNTLVNGWSSNNGGSVYNDYYDDMQWLALSLFRAYEATGSAGFLTMSTNLWNDIKTGENSNQGGGIAWRKTQLDYKNTPANAPAIIYACRRHQKWGHSWELDLATDLYSWLKDKLREPSGRINDGINRTGNSSIDYWQFTYNYGTFIGAALEMYQSTNNSTYLNDAITTADFAIQSTEISTNGIFRNEGDGDAALFKGILVRYLALLAQEPAVSVTKRNAYKAVLEDQALSIHTNGFNRTYGTIGSDWTLTAGSSVWLSAQLSGIKTLEVAADLNLSTPTAPVVVFENCFNGGYAVPIGVGSYTLNQLQALGITNDQVSSISVQSGYQATLYEHHDFTGNSIIPNYAIGFSNA